MRLLATLDHVLLQSIGRLVGRGERAARVGCGPRNAAQARAKCLLHRALTPKQRQEFARNGYFTVQVAGRGSFVILPDAMFNVLEMATGDCYCAVPATGLPIADLMLAQKLFLESDPDQFFRAANCRHEVVVGLIDDELLPERVLCARKASCNARVRWSEVSMIPYRGCLP